MVWTLGIAPSLERAQRLLERGQVKWPVIAFPELPPHRDIEAFDAAVEPETARQQYVKGNVPLLTCPLEPGHELAATAQHRVDLDSDHRHAGLGPHLP